MMQPKRVSDSRTEQVHVLMPSEVNGSGRLFGGALMQWIDVVAGVVAARHSNCNTITAAVENLNFLAPAHQGDIILLIGQVTCVGHTSVEVSVETYVEALDGTRKLVNHAYLIMVAVDENNIPQQVPGLILETEEQKTEWAAGQERQRKRKERRAKGDA